MSARRSSDLRRGALASLLACALVVPAAAGAYAAVTCKPILSIRNVREIRTTLEPRPWTWKATVAADASYCATGSGSFEIDFIRLKEYSPDQQFTERYQWRAGQFDVTMELAADESMLDYRIGFIAPCVCRDIPFE